MPKAQLAKLPAKARDIWEAAYEAAQKDGHNEERAAKIAWGAVKRAGFHRSEDGAWSKMDLAQFYITKASKGRDGVMRWAATVSEFSLDRQGDEMTPQFIKAAVAQIDAGLRPAPVLCISHIDHGKPSDSWVAGDVTDLYIDGDKPKAKGTFRDTPLGQAAFEAVRKDWRDKVPHNERARISMGFFADQVQPLELKTDNGASLLGRRFMSGWVKHLAITRVPVVQTTNITAEMELKAMAPRTKKQDAATIVGEELAEELVDLAVKSDLEADTPDMILKKDKPGAAGKGKPRNVADDEEEETTGQLPPEEVEDGEEEEAKKKEKAQTGEAVADPLVARVDQVEGLLRKLVAALGELGLAQLHPEDYEANRAALGNPGTNPPTSVKGELSDADRYMREMSDGWGSGEPDGDGDPDPEELYEFGDLTDYQYNVISFVDDWGDRVKAALLGDVDRTEKYAAVQAALNDFGPGVDEIIKAATPPSSRDLADVVSEAVKAAVTPVYNELAAVKAELENYRAGNVGGPAPQAKALDNSAIVLETALQHLNQSQPPAPQGPPAHLGLGRRGIQTKSATELAWESTAEARGY